MRGELVTTLVQGQLRPAGYHSVLWSGTDAGRRASVSGLYFYHFTAGTTSLTRRLLVLK